MGVYVFDYQFVSQVFLFYDIEGGVWYDLWWQ